MWVILILTTNYFGGMQWHSWLRHCTTSQKVTNSIPCGVTAIFHWRNPLATLWLWGCLGLYEKWVPGIFPGRYRWQLCYLHVPVVLKSGSLKLLEPSGHAQPCTGIALPYKFFSHNLWEAQCWEEAGSCFVDTKSGNVVVEWGYKPNTGEQNCLVNKLYQNDWKQQSEIWIHG
jgi:hypothetical protein